ncbi:MULTISPECIES: hypothetical protein [unclassified Microbacterium]|uniref:hypothetical protein n=1 Tax=unclassified Microbacterium TaxID=2609290 RepID=UPI002882FBD0|nr:MULTISPECIES: hypothetical protein [unclassified Microbacterium]
MADSLAGVALALIAVASLSAAMVTNTSAIAGVATKAERHAYIVSLVGDQPAMATWGTPESPHTETKTLPNGHEVEVTTWREDTPTSTTLTAVSPISSATDAVECSSPMDIAKKGCLYATRTHADDLESLQPEPLIRKDPSTAQAPVGTVDERVSTETPIPQGTTFAQATGPQDVVWRYLIDAHMTGSVGEIRITQGPKTLSVFPLVATASNYFGTFVAPSEDPILVTVSQGSAIVKTVFIYRAGSTS